MWFRVWLPKNLDEGKYVPQTTNLFDLVKEVKKTHINIDVHIDETQKHLLDPKKKHISD